MRDSFAASESVELAPNGVAGFDRNGWPASVGTGGRLPSERVAGLRRNQWPDWLGLRNKPIGTVALPAARGFDPTRQSRFILLVGSTANTPTSREATTQT